MRGRAILGSLLVVVGCSLFPDRALDSDFPYPDSELSGPEIEAQLERAEALYAEPRTEARVQESRDLCLTAISVSDEHAALWRAVRAQLWLAEHAGDVEGATLAVTIARESVRRAPEQAVNHYYLALAVGQLSRLEGGGLRRLGVMESAAKRTVELDEELEHAGASLPRHPLHAHQGSSPGEHRKLRGGAGTPRTRLRAGARLCLQRAGPGRTPGLGGGGAGARGGVDRPGRGERGAGGGDGGAHRVGGAGAGASRRAVISPSRGTRTPRIGRPSAEGGCR